MKGKSLTLLDQTILSLASEFSKIPNYEEILQDNELKKLHTFVAINIMSIRDASVMVTSSFIPAANKRVVNTKSQIQQSRFKDVLSRIDYDPNTIQQETIRLGYVFVFHKFEVFVNRLMEEMDEAVGEVSISLKKFAKSKFDFNPNEWFRNSAVHLVNFISNCTKHQDGFCRLNNPAYSIPKEFDNHSPDEKIVRTTQQFKTDIKGLMDAIEPLIKAINAIFLYRTIESNEEISLEGQLDDSYSELLEKRKLQYKDLVSKK